MLCKLKFSITAKGESLALIFPAFAAAQDQHGRCPGEGTSHRLQTSRASRVSDDCSELSPSSVGHPACDKLMPLPDKPRSIYYDSAGSYPGPQGDAGAAKPYDDLSSLPRNSSSGSLRNSSLPRPPSRPSMDSRRLSFAATPEDEAYCSRVSFETDTPVSPFEASIPDFAERKLRHSVDLVPASLQRATSDNLDETFFKRNCEQLNRR